MLTTFKRLTFLLLALSTPLAQADHLQVKNAWIPEAPPVSQVLAAYMVLENRHDEDTKIIAIESPDFGSIEMHQSKEVDGIAKMLPQKTLTIPAQGQLELKPGSYHLMLFNPKRKLRDGDKVELKISLDRGSFSIIARVKKAGSISRGMKCGAGKCGGGK
ncbi:MAG: copper chaperone PCu(A)C [Gammaproteobacteria bacterium]|nr:copper chaperone PCu(A)C [Gammaproteobacteria bacterium]